METLRLLLEFRHFLAAVLRPSAETCINCKLCNPGGAAHSGRWISLTRARAHWPRSGTYAFSKLGQIIFSAPRTFTRLRKHFLTFASISGPWRTGSILMERRSCLGYLSLRENCRRSQHLPVRVIFCARCLWGGCECRDFIGRPRHFRSQGGLVFGVEVATGVT
jgi:hypothetical protein